MEGRINNIETERVVNSELSNKTYNENERSVIKQVNTFKIIQLIINKNYFLFLKKLNSNYYEV